MAEPAIAAPDRCQQVGNVAEELSTLPQQKKRELQDLQKTILEILSEQRETILSGLHGEPASIQLQSYFERLNEGSSSWTIDSFIEGAEHFANLCGPERAEYYDNSLKGLLYEKSFVELWNKKHRLHRIQIWDEDTKRQCPPTWSHVVGNSRWVLTYMGEEHFTDGLNELIKGPTTLDCGMWCQLQLWMAIRYTFGDKLLRRRFNFPKGHFTLTQHWPEPMNHDRARGTLLYPFYDMPDSQTYIQTKTIYNDRRYHLKHSGGNGRLQNVNIFRGCSYHIFRPGASKTILSETELEEILRQAYNAPQDCADEAQMWFYKTFPDANHPRFYPKNYGALAEEANKLADHTLDEKEWRNTQTERVNKARQLHLVFNLERLIDCVKTAEEHNLGDILLLAKAKQTQEVLQKLNVKSALTTPELDKISFVLNAWDGD